jgi:hypothetical protein
MLATEMASRISLEGGRCEKTYLEAKRHILRDSFPCVKLVKGQVERLSIQPELWIKSLRKLRINVIFSVVVREDFFDEETGLARFRGPDLVKPTDEGLRTLDIVRTV